MKIKDLLNGKPCYNYSVNIWAKPKSGFFAGRLVLIDSVGALDLDAARHLAVVQANCFFVKCPYIVEICNANGVVLEESIHGE